MHVITAVESGRYRSNERGRRVGTLGNFGGRERWGQSKIMKAQCVDAKCGGGGGEILILIL